jgi:hypothetical protein
MKQCPRCRAVVRDDTECPFCHETLTYENPVMQDKPHTPWNRYAVLYWIKAIWFPVVCLAVCAVRLLTLPDTAPRFSELGLDGPLTFIGLLLLFCFLAAIFANDPFGWSQAHHLSQRYYKFRCATLMYATGTVAIICAFGLFL